MKIDPTLIPDYGTDLSGIFGDMAKRAGELTLQTVESALAAWVEQSGVEPGEFARHYGYAVEHRYEGLKMHVVVKLVPLKTEAPAWAHLLRSGELRA